MKRILLILATALAVCILACVTSYMVNMRTPPEEWIGKRLGLQGEALEAFTQAHNRYAATCSEMCARIRASDELLSHLIVANDTVTPEIEAAIAASDALSNECRRNMLAHFYEVAAMLEPAKKKEYLQLVLPLIVEPTLMAREHSHQ